MRHASLEATHTSQPDYIMTMWSLVTADTRPGGCLPEWTVSPVSIQGSPPHPGSVTSDSLETVSGRYLLV